MLMTTAAADILIPHTQDGGDGWESCVTWQGH